MKVARVSLAVVLLALSASAITRPVLAQNPVTSPDGPDAYDVTGASTCATMSLPSSYSGGTQTVAYFVPTPMPSNPAPLIVALHGSGATGLDLCNFLATEAEVRDWFVVAPDMIGRAADPVTFLPTGRYNYGYLGAQHDVIDAINYMRATYNEDSNRVYAIGNSMGGQITTLMLAKYPDVFAAGATWSALTDLGGWRTHLLTLPKLDSDPCPSSTTPPNGPYCLHEFVANEVGGAPEALPFQYQQRSSVQMPGNLRLVPLKMWHHTLDQLVPKSHSDNLRDAVNTTNPPVLAEVVPVSDSISCSAANYNHCWNPNPAVLFDFLQTHTRGITAPPTVIIKTDESKPYYWLNVQQTGGVNHWSQVTVLYTPATVTLAATISDTAQVNIGFNMGAVPFANAAGQLQPGLGLSHAQYKIVVGANPAVILPHLSGYLTVTVPAGQNSLTISPYYALYLPLVSKNP